MKKIFAYTMFAATALLVTPINAAMLTNEDGASYNVEIIVGEGDVGTEVVELQAGESLDEICMDGCRIRLDNGEELSLTGDESIVIRDSQLVLVE